jgi:hypothetical protein
VPNQVDWPAHELEIVNKPRQHCIPSAELNQHSIGKQETRQPVVLAQIRAQNLATKETVKCIRGSLPLLPLWYVLTPPKSKLPEFIYEFRAERLP